MLHECPNSRRFFVSCIRRTYPQGLNRAFALQSGTVDSGLVANPMNLSFRILATVAERNYVLCPEISHLATSVVQLLALERLTALQGPK